MENRMNLSQAAEPSDFDSDRVRRVSSETANSEIDRRTEMRIGRYISEGPQSMRRRIAELDEEWDVERMLQVNASSLALSGLVLGLTVNRKWFALPAVVLPFLLQHGLQGWCPPLPLLRRMGVRTRGEIDREKYALLEALKQE
ncbi:hypothetical protein JJB74_10495 [Noviherbaspirillum sp. DKR-6]|uniref:DUF2892 domain-containing protein n=2 Tax=Noviherbaspirillum pedocola TaxID=2801341 RepID=A0A934SSY1_9BURK|nr:hypothetical protein [Noviherbaspirillum pedocola]